MGTRRNFDVRVEKPRLGEEWICREVKISQRAKLDDRKRSRPERPQRNQSTDYCGQSTCVDDDVHFARSQRCQGAREAKDDPSLRVEAVEVAKLGVALESHLFPKHSQGSEALWSHVPR